MIYTGNVGFVYSQEHGSGQLLFDRLHWHPCDYRFLRAFQIDPDIVLQALDIGDISSIDLYQAIIYMYKKISRIIRGRLFFSSRVFLIV